MCGIAGILLPDNRLVSDDLLRSMADAMEHRGPDASGTWSRGGVGFAHTRLSLFDLSAAANQPWTDGDDALVFNGEIYNFRALRHELEAKGESFTTSSDTEVLFAALRTYGMDGALARIQGMFAFAFHEGASGTTYLCRDRYGIKPLLYGPHQGGIAFASEVKALLPVGDLEVDALLALFALRTLGDKSQTRTLFRDVQQVAPGSLVTIRGGRVVSIVDYEAVLDLIDPDHYRELDAATFESVSAQLRDILDGAVDRMAACDARLGVFLSGGVDSGLISGIAVAQGHEHFRAFTSNVTGRDSEVGITQTVAESLQLPLSVSEFRPEHWLRDWVRCTWHLETPVITNPSTIPFAQVAALAHREGYKAVLTGEGADELFLGYPRLASGGVERIARAPVTAIRRLYRRVPGLVDAVLNERDANSYDFLRGIAGGFEDTDLTSRARERYGFLKPQRAEMQAASVVMVQTSLQALLQRNDRMGMSASIESRFPFLDEQVMRFALNLPSRFKLRRSFAAHDPKHPFIVDKAPVRAIAARYVESAGRRKLGFPTAGLHSIRVRPGAFAGSWAADAFGGGRSFDREISEWHQPYDTAKLMSIEIFGRLFGARQPIEQVEQWVHENAEIVAREG